MPILFERICEMLTDNGIRISMTEKGDPYENAVAERVNGILRANGSTRNVLKVFRQQKNASTRSLSFTIHSDLMQLRLAYALGSGT